MGRVILFERPDGVVRAVAPVEPMTAGETEEEYLSYIAGIARRKNPDLANAAVRGSVPLESMPSARFRGFTVIDKKTGTIVMSAPSALRWRDGKPIIDLAAARAQILAEVRHARNAALLESDSAKAMVDEIGTEAEKAALANYRQAMRDLPEVVKEEISTMAISQLETYVPALPAKANDIEKLPTT